MIRKAVIPVAGKGTRMQPISNVMAKEMLPIGTKPTLEFIVKEAVDSGIQQILFVLNHTKGIVAKYFAGTDDPIPYDRGGKYFYQCEGKTIEIYFVYQGDKLGSGGALLYATQFAAGEPVAVLFGDDIIVGKVPATKQLIDLSQKMGYASVLGVQVKPENILRSCGVMQVKTDCGTYGIIDGLIEKPQGELPSNLASLGRFVLSADFFDVLARTPQNKGEIWLTDALSLASKEKTVFYGIFEGERYDIGNKYGYIRAFCDLAVPSGEQEEYNLYVEKTK